LAANHHHLYLIHTQTSERATSAVDPCTWLVSSHGSSIRSVEHLHFPPDKIDFRTTIINDSRKPSTLSPICIPRQVEAMMLCPSDELSSPVHLVSKVLFRTHESSFSPSLLRSVVSSMDVSTFLGCFARASADSLPRQPRNVRTSPEHVIFQENRQPRVHCKPYY
jgi:hypothetical protein